VASEGRTALYLLTDRALNGQLDALLRRWVAAGVTRRTAARLLADELGGIEISTETVRRWINEILAEDENGEAA